jgi:hypothetical protein
MRGQWGVGLWAAVLLCVGTVEARELAGKDIPESISVGETTLKLNGSAVQRKLIFNIYAIALYLEQPTRSPQQAIGSDQTKRIYLRMLRDASKNQVADALRNGVKSNNANMAPVEERLKRLLGALPDVKFGDEIAITYVPGKGTVLDSSRKDKDEMVIEGKDFADAFFRIWLGPSQGISRIRRNLLAGGPAQNPRG